jgi:hypothetical protein
MSASLSPPGDMALRVRFGPAGSVRRESRVVGSTVSVYVDAVDRHTGRIAPIVGTLAALYRQPVQADYPQQDYPVIPEQMAPGQWRVDVPTVMPGTYLGWLVLLAAGWTTQAIPYQFDVTGGL